MPTKTRFYWTYYVSTLKISIPATIVSMVIFITGGATLIESIYPTLLAYPTFGLGMDFLYKWTIRRNEFMFYRNATCSIIELLVASFVTSSLISILLFQLTKLWM